MNNTPRHYLRVKAFFRHCSGGGGGKPLEQQEVLTLIKSAFVFYWKILKDLLRENNGIIEYYPRKILKLSVSEGYIDETELVWLDYIDMLNELLYGDSHEFDGIKNKIVEVYFPKIQQIEQFMQRRLSEFSEEEFVPFLELPHDKPTYTPSDLGIYENSYNLLINCFKEAKVINYVWIHGSRAKGTALPRSDIDLLIDCPVDYLARIKEQIYKIKIPYRIDAVIINDDTNIEFLTYAAHCAKVIYRNEDFNIS